MQIKDLVYIRHKGDFIETIKKVVVRYENPLLWNKVFNKIISSLLCASYVTFTFTLIKMLRCIYLLILRIMATRKNLRAIVLPHNVIQK